jgi:hypothetical protein
MIHNQLEKPEPVTVRCQLCRQPLQTDWYWMVNRWLRATIHHQCAEAFDQKTQVKAEEIPRPIPDRFLSFDWDLADKGAKTAVTAFSPDSPLHTVALLGPPATGKSRLMWTVVKGFFDHLEATTGAKRWVHYRIFPELVAEPPRELLAEIKEARYVFIDDIGSTEAYGRDKARLQDIIRLRVQKNLWTFLTIDDPAFDPGFKDLFRDRALVVYTDA